MVAQETIFSKIIRREIPADVVYESETVLAFRDINPQAPIHILVIPKRCISGIAAADEGDRELLGDLLLAARLVAQQEGVADNGYRLVINQGRDGGQEVDHVHIHVLAGRSMTWPPG